MKRMLMLACAASAALMMTEGTASAQCAYGGGGYGGGYSGGYYGGSGISVGYSRYAPRSSFSIGYNSFPSYRTSYRSGSRYGYYPSSIRQRSYSNYRSFNRGRRFYR